MTYHRATAFGLVGTTCLLGLFALSAPAQKSSPQEVLLQRAIQIETVDGDLAAAIKLYKEILANPGPNRSVPARALLHLGQCHEKLGSDEARRAYEQLVREYADQGDLAAEARTRLGALARATNGGSVSTMALRRVWAGPDVDLEGDISPDGRYLSFIDWSTGDLAVRDLVRGENRRLTGNAAASGEFADFAAFSRDGKQLGYGWCCPGGNYDLRVVGMDGSEPRIIHRSKGNTYFLPQAWTRDGKYVLALTSDPKDQKAGFAISLVSVADGSIRGLKAVGRQFPHVSLSPDEQWIAFDLAGDENPGNRDIHVMALNGTNGARLVESPADDLKPVWTPDGRHLLFTSDRGGSLGLWMVSLLDGRAQGPPQLIKPDIGRIRPFGILDDGSFYYGLKAGTGEVYEAEFDPKTPRLISTPVPAMKRHVGFNATPDYSPDGESLACTSVRSSGSTMVPGNTMLVIRALKTGVEREILLNIAPFFELRWSPDSSAVLVPALDKSKPGLFVIDVRTGEAKALGVWAPTNNAVGSRKGWFPDGQSLYYVVPVPQDPDGAARDRLVRYSLATAKSEDIFVYKRAEGELRWVMLSPDGKQFAFWRYNDATGSAVLTVIPAAGGEPREVFSTRAEIITAPVGTPTGLSWAPDGRHLLFAANIARGSKEMALWRIAVTGGAPENVGSLPEKVYDVVVHPSGTRVAFSTVGAKNEVWVLENFLPPAKTPW